jgi:hypothetical protein
MGDAPEWQKLRSPASLLAPHLRGQISHDESRAFKRAARF